MAMKENTKVTSGSKAVENTAQNGTESWNTPREKKNKKQKQKEILDYLMHLKHIFKSLIDSNESKEL